MTILRRTDKDDKYYQEIEEMRDKATKRPLYILQYHPIESVCPTPVYNKGGGSTKHILSAFSSKGLAEEEYRRLSYAQPKCTFYIYECKNITGEFSKRTT